MYFREFMFCLVIIWLILQFLNGGVMMVVGKYGSVGDYFEGLAL